MEPESGAVRLAKVPSTPENQAAGVLAALDGAAASLADVGAIIHGTTVTTNALLERKLSRTGLITTRGFRDILELGRRTRPRPYGLTGSFTPLIPRELRFEVPERMDAAGEVLVPLDEAAVRAALERLRAADCDSLVIHFLHSYKNPAHEERALAIARECWPEGPCHGGARDPCRVPRVRAGRRGGGERLRPAAAAPLSRPLAGLALEARLCARAAGDPGQWRQRLRPLGGGEGGKHGALGAGVGRHGRRCHRSCRRCRAPDHLRYRRHQRRRGPGAGRGAGGQRRDGT